MCIVGSQAQLSGSYEVYAWFVNLLRLVIAAGFFFCGGLTPFRRFDFVPEDEESRNNFFTNAERSLVVKELLDRTSYTKPEAKEKRFGKMALSYRGGLAWVGGRCNQRCGVVLGYYMY